MSDVSPAPSGFGPSASWPRLELRAALVARIRQFFAERGFLEVETPLLSRDTIIDRHLDPLAVTLFSDPSHPQAGPTYWLQTSPEFAMKRLLAAGGRRIFQIARAFRAGEAGPLHNPEFTLVEWYAVDTTFDDAIGLTTALVGLALGGGPGRRLTYRQAFSQHVGVDPLAASVEQLAQAAAARGLAADWPTDAAHRDAWLDLLFGGYVQPRLGFPQPLVVVEFPASQSALARVSPHDPAVCQRFEVFVRGIELANGYHELADAEELARRMAENNAARRQEGKYALPEDSRLLEALRCGLPDCTGVAVGLDRLVMLAAGADDLSQVWAFPIDRA